MKMFRHNDVRHDDKPAPCSDLLEYSHEEVSPAGRAEPWLPPITTCGDEVEIAGTIKALVLLFDAVQSFLYLLS